MNPAVRLPVDVSSAKSMPPEEVIFRDGLGDRLLIRDDEGRPSQVSLCSARSSLVTFFDLRHARLGSSSDRSSNLSDRTERRATARSCRGISLISDIPAARGC